MTIAPVLNTEGEKMGPLGILTRIDDGVYECNCNIHSNLKKRHTQHAFVYDIYFSTKEKSACRGEIFDNRTYAPICVRGGKIQKNQRYTEEYA